MPKIIFKIGNKKARKSVATEVFNIVSIMDLFLAAMKMNYVYFYVDFSTNYSGCLHIFISQTKTQNTIDLICYII